MFWWKKKDFQINDDSVNPQRKRHYLYSLNPWTIGSE